MQCGILSTLPIVGLCPVGFWPVGFCLWDFGLWDFGLWDSVRIQTGSCGKVLREIVIVTLIRQEHCQTKL